MFYQQWMQVQQIQNQLQLKHLLKIIKSKLFVLKIKVIIFKSSQQQLSTSSRRHSAHDRHSSNNEPPRKRYQPKHHTDVNERHRYINNGNNYG